jgi:membrane protein DedA with SNARE-associated domain
MIEGDLTLLFAGVLAHYGLFSFGEALFVSTLGGFIGDSISYLIGYFSKETIKKSNFYRRAQPRLESLSKRFGIYSIFLVKYVYGLRTASAVLWAWALILIGLGYFFSGAIEVIIGRVKRAGILLLVAFAIALAILLFLYLIERYVIGRRVPEMAPPLIHVHVISSESHRDSARDPVEKKNISDETNEKKGVQGGLP